VAKWWRQKYETEKTRMTEREEKKGIAVVKRRNDL